MQITLGCTLGVKAHRYLVVCIKIKLVSFYFTFILSHGKDHIKNYHKKQHHHSRQTRAFRPQMGPAFALDFKLHLPRLSTLVNTIDVLSQQKYCHFLLFLAKRLYTVLWFHVAAGFDHDRKTVHRPRRFCTFSGLEPAVHVQNVAVVPVQRQPHRGRAVGKGSAVV